MSQYAYKDRPADRNLVRVLTELTDGEGIPECVSDGEGGIETPGHITPEICRVIRQLRPTLSHSEVNDLLGYTRTTISYHGRGIRSCNHSVEECGPTVEGRAGTSGRRDLDAVTDTETMVLSSSRSPTFHLNSGGDPACGRGGDKQTSRGEERDATAAYIWRDPCKICFWRQYEDDEEGMVSRRIAEIEYELAKRGQEDEIMDWGWENDD